MTRGTTGCCLCGSYEHHSHECTQPMGAEYLPEPVAHTDDAGETWLLMTPSLDATLRRSAMRSATIVHRGRLLPNSVEFDGIEPQVIDIEGDRRADRCCPPCTPTLPQPSSP